MRTPSFDDWIIVTSDVDTLNPKYPKFILNPLSSRSTQFASGQQQADEQIDQFSNSAFGRQLVHPGNRKATFSHSAQSFKCVYPPKAYSMFRISSLHRMRRVWSNRSTIAGLNYRLVVSSSSAVPVSSSSSSFFSSSFFYLSTTEYKVTFGCFVQKKKVKWKILNAHRRTMRTSL